MRPRRQVLCGDGAEDMAINTLCEDVDGRLEDMGEALADLIADGGNWGAERGARAKISAHSVTNVCTAPVLPAISDTVSEFRARVQNSSCYGSSLWRLPRAWSQGSDGERRPRR